MADLFTLSSLFTLGALILLQAVLGFGQSSLYCD